MSKQKSEWMCELCYSEGQEIGIIAPGYSLVLWESRYHILGGQGHKDHIIYTFRGTPWPDPNPLCKEELSDEKEAQRWFEDTKDMFRHFELCPWDGHSLVECCIESGFDGRGDFIFWLFDRCGKLIDIRAGKKTLMETPEREFDPEVEKHWNYRLMVHWTEVPECLVKAGTSCGIERWYAVHEVYYDEDGKPDGWTQDPVSLVATEPTEMEKILTTIQESLQNHPEVLNYGDEASDSDASRPEHEEG